MRALAEFVMKGRVQAILVAALASAVPLLFWLSGAVVGLVSLRKGVQEGFLILVFALIAPVFWWDTAQEPTPLIVIGITCLMALVLRETVSWEKAMLAGVASAFLVGYLLPVISPDLVRLLVDFGTQVLQQLNSRDLPELKGDMRKMLSGALIGSLCAFYLAISFGSLMLARSWQSALFNPGGYRQEFYSFRLSRLTCLGLVALMVLASFIESMSGIAVTVLIVPFVFAGIALAHGYVAKKNLGGVWLLCFYILVLIMGPSLLFLLVFLAILDSWIDIRGRVGPAQEK
ncbi:MAG: hypothetical protein CSA52_00445 [Gammaproteobacteria bacterium]|nr:MAG: hypothetical protein CSB48_12455 [Pseudomonadota bacterium]PIE38949.1 MAG: hypothetical protein CSA52_00445 [Gammaproteobacteria bacterium]